MNRAVLAVLFMSSTIAVFPCTCVMTVKLDRKDLNG
jgi:hypothetical protein